MYYIQLFSITEKHSENHCWCPITYNDFSSKSCSKSCSKHRKQVFLFCLCLFFLWLNLRKRSEGGDGQNTTNLRTHICMSRQQKPIQSPFCFFGQCPLLLLLNYFFFSYDLFSTFPYNTSVTQNKPLTIKKLNLGLMSPIRYMSSLHGREGNAL